MSSLRHHWQKWKWWWGGGMLAAALAVGGGVATFAARDGESFLLNAPHPPSLESFGTALFQSVAAPLRPGHDVRVVNNGQVFDALALDIERAESSIHVLMYIWEAGRASDRLSSALVERARRGVACRILVDAFGSPDFLQTVAPKLVQAGCEVRVFRPIPGSDELARNHRKIVIIDGTTGFTGGLGIRDNWLGAGLATEEWRDTHVRFRGPAVREAQQAFAENWQEAGGALLPDAAFPDAVPAGRARAAFVASTGSSVLTRAERLMQLAIGFGSARIWISNAYFVPSDAILRLLGDKAAHGVDVRVLVAGKQSDSKTSFGAQQFEYRSLRGVRVWEYQPSMLHSKAMIVDAELAIIGSINLDPLSLNVLEEAALVLQDSAVNERLAEDFVRDCTHAKELGKD